MQIISAKPLSGLQFPHTEAGELKTGPLGNVVSILERKTSSRTPVRGDWPSRKDTVLGKE